MGSSKTKAEKIQHGISNRLKKMEKAGIDSKDIKFLWDRSHELYKHAKKLEEGENACENKLHQIKELLRDI